MDPLPFTAAIVSAGPGKLFYCRDDVFAGFAIDVFESLVGVDENDVDPAAAREPELAPLRREPVVRARIVRFGLRSHGRQRGGGNCAGTQPAPIDEADHFADTGERLLQSKIRCGGTLRNRSCKLATTQFGLAERGGGNAVGARP